jgi:hypothetical protein
VALVSKLVMSCNGRPEKFGHAFTDAAGMSTVSGVIGIEVKQPHQVKGEQSLIASILAMAGCHTYANCRVLKELRNS